MSKHMSLARDKGFFIPPHKSGCDSEKLDWKSILVRSTDRLASSASSNSFECKFQEPIEGYYVLRWATIPNSLYNVTSSNNQIYFIESTVSYVGTIEPGNYTGKTLATAIETAMDAVSPVVHTVFFNPITGKLSVFVGVGTVGFEFGSNTLNTAAKVMGFADADVAEAANVEGVKSVFLGYPLSLGIQFTASSTVNFKTAGGQYRTTPSGAQAWETKTSGAQLIIPLLASYGVYNFNSSDVHRQVFHVKAGRKVMRFSIIDPGTNAVVDLNGGEWEMLWERVVIEHERDPRECCSHHKKRKR